MDYRCSSSVAGMVLLLGSSLAFLVPTVRAGDPIDFSDPVIPLAVPLPDVEIKEPQKLITSFTAPEDPTYNADFIPPQQIMVTKPRTKDKDPWKTDPLMRDSDSGTPDDLFNARSEVNRLTNGNVFKWQRDSDANDADHMLLKRGDSKNGADESVSRFGARSGWDKDNGREGDLFGRDYSNKKNESSLLKVFNLDPASSERLNAWESRSFTGQGNSLTGYRSGEEKTKTGLSADSARSLTLPPAYGSYDPSDTRQAGVQAAPTPGYGRSWEPADSRPAPPKRASNPDQFNANHVVAPSRPINLKIPKRPSDPNPY